MNAAGQVEYKLPLFYTLLSFATFVLVLVAGSILMYFLYGQTEPGLSVADFPSNYQAIFLTNNQVYFGQLQEIDQNFVILEDIYYFQTNTEETDDFSLVKLGEELHGPMDIMHINLDQVLFIEDLRSDSQVVQAINNYRAGGN